MISIDREVDRYLTLLRNKIREKGFTQLEVQEALGWGRSYISQLLTKQKTLRLEQVLLILNVIGIEPRAFFGELYGADLRQPPLASPAAYQELEQMRRMLQGLAELLFKRGLITNTDLSEAVAKQKLEPE